MIATPLAPPVIATLAFLAIIAAFGIGLVCGLLLAARIGQSAEQFEEGDRQ